MQKERDTWLREMSTLYTKYWYLSQFVYEKSAAQDNSPIFL